MWQILALNTVPGSVFNTLTPANHCDKLEIRNKIGGEAAAMMMRMYDRLNMPIEDLHAFYAISSYSQIDLIDSLMLRDGKVINSTPGRPSYEDILKRIQTGAEKNYSGYYQNPNIHYYDNADDTNNVVWYENVQSIQAKITLTKMFGISGISLWRLRTVPDYMKGY